MSDINLDQAKCANASFLKKPRIMSREKLQANYKKIFPWVRTDERNDCFAFCAICQCRLAARKSDLKKHELSAKHATNALKLGRMPNGSQIVQNEQAAAMMQQRPTLTVKDFPNFRCQTPAPMFNGTSELPQEHEQQIHENHVNDNSWATPPTQLPNPAFFSTFAEGNTMRSPQNNPEQCVETLLNDQPEMSPTFNENSSGEDIKLPIPLAPDNLDPLQPFFESVFRSVKALPPIYATEAKIGIMQLVGQLELKALRGNCVPPNGSAAPCTT